MDHSNSNGEFVNRTFTQRYCKAKLKERKYEQNIHHLWGESQVKKNDKL